jgi:hypothetical protein
MSCQRQAFNPSRLKAEIRRLNPSGGSASEHGIPNGACGKRNDVVARPPVAAEVLGCFETRGRVQPKGESGA